MKKKTGKKKYLWLAFVQPLLALSGCGKSIDQIVKTGQDLIGIAGETYKDLKRTWTPPRNWSRSPTSPAK